MINFFSWTNAKPRHAVSRASSEETGVVDRTGINSDVAAAAAALFVSKAEDAMYENDRIEPLPSNYYDGDDPIAVSFFFLFFIWWSHRCGPTSFALCSSHSSVDKRQATPQVTPVVKKPGLLIGPELLQVVIAKHMITSNSGVRPFAVTRL